MFATTISNCAATAILLSLLILNANAQVSNNTTTAKIAEEKFVLINGIEQWITIKGNASKPAILFLHGGPGSPMSPYADSLLKDWQKDFIIVQWDQRGTGRTFGLSAPEELTPEWLQANPLTIQQMRDDGIAVAEYLTKHLGKQKLILSGTSWGSVLGVEIASKRPDLFYAYIGHSQVVQFNDAAMYHKVFDMAVNNKDTAALNILETIGKPPYDRARSLGRLFFVVKQYERAASTPAPAWWFIETPAYNNAKDARNRENGDDYSFANFAGDKQLGVASMRTNINFVRDKTEFKIPVYFIQGDKDILTPKENSKAYFEKIKAPHKEYFLVPDAAHGFNESILEKLHEVCRAIAAKPGIL